MKVPTMPNEGTGAKAPDYYPLTYRDPTGETAIANLMGREYTITSPNGVRILIDLEDLKPLLRGMRFQLSRRGKLWARAKEKSPAATGLITSTHE